MKTIDLTSKKFRGLAARIVLGILLALCCSSAAIAKEKVAILYVYPQDAKPELVHSPSDLERHFRGPIKNFWREQSYGKYDYEASFFYWKYPLSSAQTDAKNDHYVVDMLKNQLPDGGNFTVPGYVPSEYSKTIILLGGGFLGFGGGMGSTALKVNGVDYPKVHVGSFTYLNKNSQFFSKNFRFGYYRPGAEFKGKGNGEETGYPELGLTGEDGILLHEWGHGIGLSSHASYWRSETEPLYGEIYWSKERSFWNQESGYGNYFDIMGSSPPKYALHMNAFYKDFMGWLEPSEKVTITESQTGVKLMPLQSQEQGVKKAAIYKIPAGKFSRPAPFDNNLEYALYFEYRQPMGFDKHLGHEYLKSNTEGLMINLTRRQGSVFVAAWLLDMSPDGIVYDKAPSVVNPGSANEDDHHEATLNAGKTFYDDQIGITITNVRADGANGVTFDVQLGKKSGLASGVYDTADFVQRTGP